MAAQEPIGCKKLLHFAHRARLLDDFVGEMVMDDVGEDFHIHELFDGNLLQTPRQFENEVVFFVLGIGVEGLAENQGTRVISDWLDKIGNRVDLIAVLRVLGEVGHEDDGGDLV